MEEVVLSDSSDKIESQKEKTNNLFDNSSNTIAETANNANSNSNISNSEKKEIINIQVAKIDQNNLASNNIMPNIPTNNTYDSNSLKPTNTASDAFPSMINRRSAEPGYTTLNRASVPRSSMGAFVKHHSPYTFYVKSLFASQSDPAKRGKRCAEYLSLLAQRWKTLSDQEKKPYIEMALKYAEEYRRNGGEMGRMGRRGRSRSRRARTRSRVMGMGWGPNMFNRDRSRARAGRSRERGCSFGSRVRQSMPEIGGIGSHNGRELAEFTAEVVAPFVTKCMRFFMKQ